MLENQQLGKKLTLHYAIIQIVFIMGYCTMLSFAAVFLTSRGLSNAQIGITLTVGSAASIILQPLIASFADGTEKYSLRFITAIITFAMAILSLLLLIMPPFVIPTMILYILLLSIFSPQISLVTALAMEHINSGTPINFSIARGFGSVAYALLSFVMGFLVERFDANVVMFVNLIIAISGAVLVLAFRKPEKPVNEESRASQKASGLWTFIKNNKRFVAVVFSVALLFFSHIVINTFLINVIENVGGSSGNMGVALAISGLLEMPGMILFPLLAKRFRYAGSIMKLAGLFVFIKSLSTFLAINMAGIYAAQTLQMLSFAVFLPASVYYVNQVIVGADKVKGQSFMTMAFAISNIFGNIIGGFILDYGGGVPAMLITGTVVTLAGLILLIWLDKGLKRKYDTQIQVELT